MKKILLLIAFFPFFQKCNLEEYNEENFPIIEDFKNTGKFEINENGFLERNGAIYPFRSRFIEEWVSKDKEAKKIYNDFYKEFIINNSKSILNNDYFNFTEKNSATNYLDLMDRFYLNKSKNEKSKDVISKDELNSFKEELLYLFNCFLEDSYLKYLPFIKEKESFFDIHENLKSSINDHNEFKNGRDIFRIIKNSIEKSKDAFLVEDFKNAFMEETLLNSHFSEKLLIFVSIKELNNFSNELN